jgi:hypothetical protein
MNWTPWISPAYLTHAQNLKQITVYLMLYTDRCFEEMMEFEKNQKQYAKVAGNTVAPCRV